MATQSMGVMAALVPAAISFTQPVYTPIWPTRPQVPMPEETAAPFISKWNRQVASGPVMAEASVGAIQIRGFLMILPIWSILVPRPWLTRPPTPFSL